MGFGRFLFPHRSFQEELAAPGHGNPGSGDPNAISAHTVLRGVGPSLTPQAVLSACTKPVPRLGVGPGELRLGEPVGSGVGDLDTEGAAEVLEEQQEVPSGYAAVLDGVVGEFGDDETGGVQREAPGAELFRGEETGEAGASAGGGELNAEVVDGGCGLGEFLNHVTQSGRIRLPFQ